MGKNGENDLKSLMKLDLNFHCTCNFSVICKVFWYIDKRSPPIWGVVELHVQYENQEKKPFNCIVWLIYAVATTSFVYYVSLSFV